MAQQTTVTIVDDVDGGEGTHSDVSFSVEGVTYEIDLSDKNYDKLMRALKPFIENGRRLSGRHLRRVGAKAPTPKVGREQTRAIREWAAGAGIEVANRGRIPMDVVAKFQAAHG